MAKGFNRKESIMTKRGKRRATQKKKAGSVIGLQGGREKARRQEKKSSNSCLWERRM